MEKKTLTFEELLAITIESEDEGAASDSELLEVVDKAGNSLGLAPPLICHRLGLIHKVVYAVVENNEGDILLQTRGDTSIGRLDVAVGGHVSPDDASPLEAMIREMHEELAFNPDVGKLELIAKYNRTEKHNPRKPREVNREQR